MEEGAIVHVDYDLFDGASGDLIETTREATAKEHETHQEGREYTPMVCVVGGGNLIPGFESALLEAEADKDIDITIPAAEAYGEKDPAQMEKDTSSKIYNRNRARWGDVGDNSHSDFKFAPEVGNNDLTEKEQMN